jgi:NAD(P)-dependent dehydrogenase (short-subunit alcohol dehydrogenase family)
MAVPSKSAVVGYSKGWTGDLGRIGTAADVAAAVPFLVAPESSYITGTALTVDGGLQPLWRSPPPQRH